MPATKLMGRAYSPSHFSLGFLISRPHTTITSAETAEISLAGNFAVTDIGMPESQKVPAVSKNGRTVFKTRLAPSEMTLLKLVNN